MSEYDDEHEAITEAMHRLFAVTPIRSSRLATTNTGGVRPMWQGRPTEQPSGNQTARST